jgi:hypothetical protein
VGNTTVFGNLFASNLVGNTTVFGNLFASNIYSNLVGNTTVFGNLFASNVSGTLGTCYISGNLNAVPSGSNIIIQGVTNPLTIGGALSDETTTITTNSILTIRSPYAFTIRSYQPPYFWLNTLPSDYVTFDIRKNTNSIYTTGNPPTILSSYTTTYSTTSNAGTLIGGTNTFAQGDLIQFKVTYPGASGATGAKVVAYFS